MGRFTLSIGVAAALLAGCGAPTSPIGMGGSGAVPPSPEIAMHDAQSLVYVTDEDGGVSTLAYPSLVPVGSRIPLNNSAQGSCVDKVGDVFIVTDDASNVGTIFEFAHGGTEPIAELPDPAMASGCSVDPQTGNLAVSNYSDPSNDGAGDLAVYPHAHAPPTFYYSTAVSNLYYCAYDNAGNLFADGRGQSVLYELPKGAPSLTAITLEGVSKYSDMPGGVQWDGTHVTMGNLPFDAGPEMIYRLTVEGSEATIVGTTTLKRKNDRHQGTYWIQGRNVVAIDMARNTSVGLWRYPRAEKPIDASPRSFHEQISVTVSLALRRESR